MKNAQNHDSGVGRLNTIIKIIAIVLVVVPTGACQVVVCFTSIIDKAVQFFLISFGAQFISQLTCIVAIQFIASKGVEHLDQKLQSLNELLVVNSCVDEYTVVQIDKSAFREG